ncbi:transposase [Staphylococcus chromogenes]
MIKNKWKIELWFQSFSYFIHKINSEFILKEYEKDILPEEIRTNYVVGEAQPNETIYISYFVNTSDQNIEQHTVKCSEDGIFIDKIPSGFTKDNLTYSIDSQSMVDIDELSNEIIDQGVDTLDVLESTTLDTYFTEFLTTINKTTDFAKKIANNTIKQIQENIDLTKVKYKIDY